MPDIDKLKRRAAAILNQAANAANEHEKRVFQDKAFKLMADYGLSEAELRAMQADPGKVVLKRIVFSGTYNFAQCQLMHRLAESLHCQSTHKTSYSSGMIYGVESHVQRVVMLFEILAPQLIKEMSQTQPWQAKDPDWKRTTYWTAGEKAAITREHRRGFGIGFAEEIGVRLWRKENAMVTEARESADENQNKAALVLMADHEKAQKALELAHPGKKLRVAQIKTPEEGYHDGRAAGSRADMGDRTLKNKIAIGA